MTSEVVEGLVREKEFLPVEDIERRAEDTKDEEEDAEEEDAEEGRPP